MHQDPFDSMNLNVGFSIGSKNPNPKMKFLMYNDKSLLNIISQTDIDKTEKRFGSFDTESLSKHAHLFEVIKEKRKSIKYQVVFRRTMPKKNLFARYKKGKLWYTIPKLCQNQVHPAQVQQGIRTICWKLLPPQLIGNDRNRKKVLKTFRNLMDTAKNEPFNLSSLIKSLKLDSITWIRDIRDENQKLIIMSKFIKWLFQVFISITERVFVISHVKGIKVFIFKTQWENQKDDLVKLMCQRSALQLIGPAREYPSIQSRLCFVPKRNSLRPITMHKFTDTEEQLLRQTNALLRYLYEINYQAPKSSLQDKLIVILDKYKRQEDTIFAVSCDINDAYGSIVHGKLVDILSRMMENLPALLKFSCSIVRQVKRYYLITEDSNIILRESQKCEIVTKDSILKTLKKYIFQTRVVYKNNIYNVNRGVTQGLMISGILCSIYYKAMNAKYFKNFETSGHLFNYVDDYLFVTNERRLAEEFLHKTENKISEFNCSFNKLKSKHNLHTISKNVEFLGWSFNFNPIKIEPTFNSTRHSLCFSSLDPGNLVFKIKQLGSLKLSLLVLSKKLNDHDRILNNIAKIYQRQAERTFALLTCLYNTHRKKVDVKLIEHLNYYLLWKIQKFTCWDKNETTSSFKTMQCIALNSLFIMLRKKGHILLSRPTKCKMPKWLKKRVRKMFQP